MESLTKEGFSLYKVVAHIAYYGDRNFLRWDRWASQKAKRATRIKDKTPTAISGQER